MELTLGLVLAACLFAAIGAAAGYAVASVLARARGAQERELIVARADNLRGVLEERIEGLEALLDQARADHAAAVAEARLLAESNAGKATRIGELETRLTGVAQSRIESEARLKSLVTEAEKRFTDAFEVLASRILEDKTARFTETNRTRLNELLEPFRDRLKELQKRIEDTHLSETTDRRSLKEELKRLMDLNQQVSAETRNLTTALKGESRTQGVWGEVVLETTLQMSGLTRGREYHVQETRHTEDGERQRPDIVINLPENRHLVVDSKVSLSGFDRYCRGENDDARSAGLKDHLVSIHTHIRRLGEKNYASLYGLDSLDFVLMFVPAEAAFLAAVQSDTTLYETAWKRNILLVSPTTLMATARIVESVWRLDRQNRNAMRIAEQAGRMHDTFVQFLNDLEKAAKAIQDAGERLDDAVRRLHTGRGNLVRRAQEIQRLGAKTFKDVPPPLIELADELADELDDDLEEATSIAEELRH